MHNGMMNVEYSGHVARIIFSNVENKNAINKQFLEELNCIIDKCESRSECRIVSLEGRGGNFCTGMDFNEYLTGSLSHDTSFVELYSKTLNRFSTSSLYIISKIDGTVKAGGVGIAAASDIVLATPTSQFSLPEALWGLIPAMVTPYLIRRVGFQQAYFYTISTLPIPAEKASQIGLVDQLCDSLDDCFHRLMIRLSRVETESLKTMKTYFRSMWILNDSMELNALNQIQELMGDKKVMHNIHRYVNEKKLPWES